MHLQFTGSPAVPAGDLEANAEGAISAQSIRVPALPEGQHSLVAVGEQSGRGGAAIISVLGFSPWVVLGAYAPRPGESFGFAGAGFAPGDSVDVYLDGSSSPMATVTTDDEGGVQVQTLLRASPGDVGKHNLEFVAKNTGLSLPVAFEVLAFVPTTELSPYAGPPGTTVTFSGKGFAPGESVRAYLDRDDGRQEVSAFEADPTGSFERAGSYVVPAGDTNLTLILEGEDSGVPVSQRFGVLPLSPWAGTSSYSGPPGTQISFRGKGFAAGENVHIYDGESGNADKLASAIADENGSFESALFVIPPGAPDVLTFRFVGERSGGAATTEFTVTAP